MNPKPRETSDMPRRPRPRWLLVASTAVVVLAAAAGVQLLRGVPSPEGTAILPRSLRTVPDPPGGGLPWPNSGAAAMAVPGVITFPPVGPSSPLPVASITKVMTVLVLLHDHPLALGQQGPTITVTAADAAQYAADQATQDSDVPVTAGEQLTELEAIEAMLVPSADNVAQLVAQWAAGSEASFVDQMNQLASQWGLASTRFTDVSGLSAGSVSTTADLLELGERAMANPVISSVVSLPSVTLPDSPKPLPTYDFALDEDGIVGIKTGSDSAAGGCFLFAAQVDVRGVTKLAYGVVLGQESPTSELDQALDIGAGLVQGLDRVLAGIPLVQKDQTVASLGSAWTSADPIEAGKTVSVIAPPGVAVRTSVKFDHLRNNSVAAGSVVGQMTVQVGSTENRVQLIAERTLRGPSLDWRLVHL